MDFNYKRRLTTAVKVGNTVIGGTNPIRLQSMTNTSTMDTEGSVEQVKQIVEAGADIVRLTAQGIREAENMGQIRSALRDSGYDVPLVADIHFNPKAAFVAAEKVEKVRINPGNFVDPGRTFKKIEFTDEEYADELKRLENALVPFYETCRKNGTAVRIGVNHGSLSDRIMSRYGDTPAGMVESAMEFLRVAGKIDFNDIVISIKASNTTVMVETVRRLVKAMDAEGMSHPLHLGVTEAGDGEDGRVKSAIGIGTLLADGIGDTIRVSLSEAPEKEVPVAKELRDYIAGRENAPYIKGCVSDKFDKICPKRRITRRVGCVGGGQVPVVVGSGCKPDSSEEPAPDIFGTESFIVHDTSEGIEKLVEKASNNPDCVLLITTSHINPVGAIRSAIHGLIQADIYNPVIVKLHYGGDGIEDWQVRVRAAADFGALLLDGITDGIMIDTDILSEADGIKLAFSILQGTRSRITRPEYIACPGCGRTMFDLQTTLAEVKKATCHLKGLKIGVMGCIVNGPGEMADADYGYVGAGIGKVSLYRGKECVERNIPQENAISRLIDLLKHDGVWCDK